MIETERLILRGWRAADAAAHQALCNDPRVIATLGLPPSLADSVDVVRRQNAILAEHGHCFWAMADRASGDFIGWCGIKPGHPPIEGETEIGWTVSPDRWGGGLAREAAAAVLDWAWANTAIDAVTAITTPGNLRSRGLMERLGMIRDPAGDFDHPDVADGSPLKRHLTYRIARPISRPAAP